MAVAKAGEEARTCLPDAVYALLCNFDPSLEPRLTAIAVRDAFITAVGDPTQAMAKQFAALHGVRLVHQPRMTGSPKSLLSETSGVFLVRLRLEVPDGSSDYHYVVYEARRALVIDNSPRLQLPDIKDEDRADNRSAIRVFFHYFPNATAILVASVLRAEVL